MLSRLTGIVFALLLVVGVPALSFMTARRSDIRLVPRLALYVSAVISQWALALLGVVAVLAGTASFSALGFRAVPAAAFLRWTVFVTLVLLAGLGIVMILEHFGCRAAASRLG